MATRKTTSGSGNKAKEDPKQEFAEDKSAIATPAEESQEIADAEVIEEVAPHAPESKELEKVAPPSKQGVHWIFPAVIGAIAGAGTALGVNLYIADQTKPSVVADPDPRVAVVEQSLAELKAQLADLESEQAALAARPVPEPGASTKDLAALAGQVAELQRDLKAGADERAVLSGADTSLSARIADLEARPVAEVLGRSEVEAMYEAELARIEARVEERLKEIEAARNAAEEAANSADDRIAAAKLQSDLSLLAERVASGLPYEQELDALAEPGQDVSAVLGKAAATGVASQADLESGFAAAARPALEASLRAMAESGEIDKATAFMRIQLGIRSLQPQQGNDPDAVLSRAEAALRNGDLEASLSELVALPPTGREVMADWVTMATLRQEVLAAVAQLEKSASR